MVLDCILAGQLPPGWGLELELELELPLELALEGALEVLPWLEPVCSQQVKYALTKWSCLLVLSQGS